MHYSKKTQSKQTKMQNTKDKKKILKTTREKKNDFNKSLKWQLDTSVPGISTVVMEDRLGKGAEINCQLRLSNKNTLHKLGQNKEVIVT